MEKKIIIASKNPVKINAVKIGFNQTFPNIDFSFEGKSVPSGVSDQPMSDGETILGATNRAQNARVNFPEADFWIGIEGGIEQLENDMMAFAWIVILSNKNIGKGRTGTFFLPKKVTALIQQGMELGEADDIVFGDSNSKQKSGAVGLLTNNIIDRTQLYVPAITLALIPFQNPELYRPSF